MVAICYQDGLGVKQNRKEGTKWFQKAAEQGEAMGAYGLGVCYLEGYGIEPDMTAAVKWFQKASEQDESCAQCALGYCYACGLGVMKDSAKAELLFKESITNLRIRAEEGDNEAQMWLGICYENGWSVKQDEDKAKAWLLAAEQENDRAQVALARYYLKVGDRKVAERWLRKAVKRDNPTAKKLLNELFPQDTEDETEKSVQLTEIGATIAHLQTALKTSDTEVVTWIRNAAEQGNPKAQCGLGICYWEGCGVTKDAAEMKKWFAKGIEGLRKGAESDDPEAQTLLAICYGKGYYVKADATLSLIWLRKAAGLNYSKAQLMLALMYLSEKEDLREGDRWLRKAIENGETDAEKYWKHFFLKTCPRPSHNSEPK